MWEIMTNQQRALYLGMLWTLGVSLGRLDLPTWWAIALILPVAWGVEMFFYLWIFGGDRWRW